MKILRLALLLFASCFLPFAFGQKKPMDFDDVMKLKSVGSPQISPDGKWVAYTVTAADIKENAVNSDLWLVSTSGDAAPRQLTRHPKNDGSPRWSPDGRQIAFLSDRAERAQIYLMAPDGGEPEKLTDSKTAVSGFQWSPDGKQIAYLATDPPTEAEEKREKDKDDAQVTDHNFRMTHLWVIDLAGKKARRLTHGAYTVSDPQWSPDGRQIAYVTRPTPRADDGGLSDIWAIAANADDAGGAPRRLAGGPGPESAPRWSPDGKQILFTGQPDSSDTVRYNRLYVAGIDEPAGRRRELDRAAEYDPQAADWSPDGKWIYFAAAHGTVADLLAVAADNSAVRRIGEANGVLGGWKLSKDGRSVAFTWADSEHPAEVYFSSLDSFRPTRLTDTNPQVKDLALGRTEALRWKSRDGMEVEGLLLYPVNYEPGKKYPLLVYVHGGPSGVYLRSFMANWGNFGQVWAGKGWACFYPNFRGSTGYGESFQRANINGWGKGDYQDIQSGIDLLVQRGLADPDRLAQTGWSYGGYMTAWTITQTTRFKAAMVGAGLTNMFSMYSTNDLQRVLDNYFGGQPWQKPEAYMQASAMSFIRQARTPTLILHGAADQRVPPTQGRELYIGLQKNGVPVEFVTFPREPHGLGEPRHQLDKMKREYAWIARHTLGREAEAATAETVKIAPANFAQLAKTIVASLEVQAGERVLMHFDATYYPELVDELRQELYRTGAVQVGATLADTAGFAKTRAGAKESPEYLSRQAELFKKMLGESDIFLWLPMRAGRGLPIEKLMQETAWKGRAIHFHWVAQPFLERGPEMAAWLAGLYEEALKVDAKTLGATQDRLIAALRGGRARLTTPAGTDLTFRVADRPFHKNDGIATRERAALADKTGSLRDREFELPAGALRVIPVEDSWEGTLVLPKYPYGQRMLSNVKLVFKNGRITEESARANPEFFALWSRETGDRDRAGELVVGTNPRLAPVDDDILPYYGYGSGVVRIALGDNWESGGRNRSSLNQWLFLTGATLEVGGKTIIREGRLE